MVAGVCSPRRYTRLNRAASLDAGLTISAKSLPVIEIVPSEEE
jgi:hypothetical protein